MSNGSGRFMFAGHAIGAAAQFHRLDELENLNHVIPTLAASVLPVTGGRSEGHLEKPYRFDVDQPRKRCLLAVDRIDTWAEGRGNNGAYETELSVEIGGMQVVEKLHIDLVRLHMHSARNGSADPVVTTKGNRIEGMRLGNVEVRMTIDDEPLTSYRHRGPDHEVLPQPRRTDERRRPSPLFAGQGNSVDRLRAGQAAHERQRPYDRMDGLWQDYPRGSPCQRARAATYNGPAGDGVGRRRHGSGGRRPVERHSDGRLSSAHSRW